MKLDWRYLKTRWDDLKSHKAFQKAPVQTIFRVGIWALHCLFKVPATIELPRWGCQFFLPPKFRQAGSSGVYITREDYDPELAYLERVLSPGKVFIDGGANFGIYTVVAGKLVGDSGRVLSFEPGVESCSVLKRNVELNQLNNVTVINSALSDSVGVARLYHVADALNSYSLAAGLDTQTGFEETHTTTIDRVLQNEGIDRVDMLKLDVEGVEELALYGAKELFTRVKPTVLFEVSEEATGRLGLSRDGAWHFLQEFGYQLFMVGNKGDLLSLESPRTGNNIAIPREYNPRTSNE